MKNILIFTVFCASTFSCSQMQCNTCTEDQKKSLESIANGDYNG